MTEVWQIKISAQLPVDPREQVHVERRRHSGRIVISQYLNFGALLQVRAQEQRIAFAQYVAHTSQKFLSCIAVEIPDRAPKKQHQQMIAIGASIRHRPQSFQIWLFVPDNTHQIDLPQLLLARSQCGRRNLDREVIRFLPPRKRFQNPARLFSASAAEFRDVKRRRQPADDLTCMLLEQSSIRARQPVFRQNAYRLKQRGAHFVVQIF